MPRRPRGHGAPGAVGVLGRHDGVHVLEVLATARSEPVALGIITGALTYGKVLSGPNGTATANGSGTATIPVTLR